MILLSFIAGILFQSLFYIRTRSDIKNFAYCLLGSLVAFAPFEYFQGETIYLFFAHLVFYFLFYIALFSITFKRQFLKVISEIDLLQYGILLLYILFLRSTGQGAWLTFSLIFAVMLILLGLVLAFTKKTLTKEAKLFCYVLYLVANIVLLTQYIPLQSLLSVIDSQPPLSIQALSTAWNYDLFITGTTIFLFVINFCYVMLLLPIKGNTINDMEKHGKLLIEKFADTQVSRLYSVILIIIQVGLYGFNFMYNFIDSATLIYLSLIMSSFVLPKTHISYVKK